ncbi:hypothetical protein PR048_004788 [Dryococelus australis]|uniref:Uncharacterized protein n=1 Tax=Dryococelus australis TaxID=614101 RepID=A0ABQ9I8E8_9NEOP|nr:hypothetical protein PR048_004788 [Dryococelus australis]
MLGIPTDRLCLVHHLFIRCNITEIIGEIFITMPVGIIHERKNKRRDGCEAHGTPPVPNAYIHADGTVYVLYLNRQTQGLGRAKNTFVENMNSEQRKPWSENPIGRIETNVAPTPKVPDTNSSMVIPPTPWYNIPHPNQQNQNSVNNHYSWNNNPNTSMRYLQRNEGLNPCVTPFPPHRREVTPPEAAPNNTLAQTNPEETPVVESGMQCSEKLEIEVKSEIDAIKNNVS